MAKRKRKDRLVTIRLSPQERRALQAMADDEGVTLSALVRRVCNEAAGMGGDA